MTSTTANKLKQSLKDYLVLSDIADQIGSAGLNVVDKHSSKILHEVARGAEVSEVEKSVQELAQELSNIHEQVKYFDSHIQSVHSEELQKILD